MAIKIKCDTCDGWLEETGEVIDNQKCFRHTNKRKARECMKRWAAQKKYERGERMLARLM